MTTVNSNSKCSQAEPVNLNQETIDHRSIDHRSPEKNDFMSSHSILNSRSTELFLPLMLQTIVTPQMLRRVHQSQLTLKFEWLPFAEMVRQN